MIKDIYRINFMRNHFSYVGTLRNEKKFNLHDNVWFAFGQEIFRGKVVGVELPPEQNPEYKYKIKIPEELVKQFAGDDDFYEGKNLDRIELKCDKIFSTVEEAKQSALKKLKHMEELQRKEIENYFKQFE